MPKSALPPHLQDIESNFKDDDQYMGKWYGSFYRWIHKKTKTYFAFSYRCTERWARWRMSPKCLFKIGGVGPWRYESRAGETLNYSGTTPVKEQYISYLSRVQYHKSWHLAIQWPLMISFHVYLDDNYRPLPGDPTNNLDGKLIFFYWNHFDADLVYWMVTSIYAGKNWK